MKIKKITMKKALSIFLATVMMLTVIPVLPQYPMTASAAESDGATDLISNLGFKTDISAESQEELESKDNPLGPGTTALVKIPELLVSSTSFNSNGTWNQMSNVFGKKMSGQGDSRFMGDTGDDLLVDPEMIVDTVGGARAIREVAFDPTGCGRANYIGRMLLLGHTLVFRLINADTKLQVGAQFNLCGIPFLIEEHQVGTLLSMVAGDFDADGSDELAIYVPSFFGDPQVVIYEANPNAAHGEQPLAGVLSYNLISICGLTYYYDYSEPKWGEHYTRWPAVDMAVASHKSTDAVGTDDLLIAVSPSRNIHKKGAPSWKDAPNLISTRLIYAPNPMNEKIDGNGRPVGSYYNVFHMKWNWNQVYGRTGKYNGYDSTEYWEAMLFGGVTEGDINGDGYDDFIIAGYRIAGGTNEGFYPYDNVTGNSEARMDQNRYLITYMQYDPKTGVYNVPAVAQWVDAKYENNYKITEHLASKDNRVDNILEPMAVASFADRGSGYADSIFVNGAIVRLNNPDNPPGNNTSENINRPEGLKDARFASVMETVYKIQFGDIWSGTQINRWTSQPTAGNFNGDPLGREQLVFLYGYKTNTGGDDVKAVFHIGSIEQGAVAESWKIRHTNNVTVESYYCAASICVPDLDNDSRLIRFAEKKDFSFTTPYVAAVLQAAPYFEDLGAGGSTTFAKSRASGGGEEHSVSVVAGMNIGQEVELLLFSQESELSLELSAGYTHAKEHTTTFSTSYSADATDDSVVLFMTPYINYHCQVYLPSVQVVDADTYNNELAKLNSYISDIQIIQAGKSDGNPDFDSVRNKHGITKTPYLEQEEYRNLLQKYYKVKKWIDNWNVYLETYSHGAWTNADWHDTIVSMPQTSRQTMMSVTEYDRVAVESDGVIEPIRAVNKGKILTSSPGNPFSYSKSPPVGWKGGEMVGAAFPINFAGLGTGPSAMSQSIEFEESTSNGVSWGASAQFSQNWKIGGVKFGWNVGLEYEGGYNWISSKGWSYEGQVASISAAAKSAGYDFQWQFGYWDSMINGEKCVVLGYILKDVDAPPSAPRNLFASDVRDDRIGISWEPGVVPGAYYEVYRLSPQGTYYHLTTIESDPTADSYTYYDMSCNSNTEYRYVVQASSGARNSVESGLTVRTNPAGKVPIITAQPEDQQCAAGEQVSFSVTATPVAGNPPLNYRWQVSSGGAWSDVPQYGTNGVKTATLTLAAAKNLNGNRYRCIVTQMVDFEIVDVFSNSALLSVGATTSSTQISLLDAGGTAVTSGPANGSYDVTETKETASSLPIKATLSGVEYEVVRPGVWYKIPLINYEVLIPDPGNQDYYLRGNDPNGVFYYLLTEKGKAAVKDSDTQTVALEAEDATLVTFERNLKGGEITIDAAILDKTPLSGDDPIVARGIEYAPYNDESDENEPPYYYIIRDETKEVYVCVGEDSVIRYFALEGDGDYVELTLTEEYSADGSMLNALKPNLLVPHTGIFTVSTDTVTTETQAGTPVTLTAGVTGDVSGSVPTGTVTFTIKNTSNGKVSVVTAQISGGVARYIWMPTEAGIYSIQAYYGGGSDFASSRSDVANYTAYSGGLKTLGIEMAADNITYGDSVSLSAKLIENNGVSTVGTPVGATFSCLGPKSTEPQPITGGSFTPGAAGEWLITARYQDGDKYYTAKTSVTVAGAPLTVRAGEKHITALNAVSYDINADRSILTVSGVADSDDEGAIKGCFTMVCNLSSAPGRYTIGINYDANNALLSNYSISTISGQLYVMPSQLQSFEVTVDSSGTGAIGSGTYEQGQIVTISAGTPPAGMRFKNWTSVPNVTFADATDPNTSFAMPASKVTVTANFEPAHYTMSFNVDGGSAVSAMTGVAHGSTINAPAEPKKSGYAFGGWYLEAELTNAWTFGAGGDIVTGDTTLYAKWSTVAVTDVTLNKTATTILKGGSETLTATVVPANAANQNVSWESSDESVATVSDGIVMGIEAGMTTITATTVDGEYTATCEVTVTETSADVTGVTLNRTSITLAIGDHETLAATITPSEATNQNVIWESNDESVATVSGGIVTGIDAGTATITATTEDGRFTATCSVTVSETFIAVTNITNLPSSATAGTTLTLSGTVYPANATNRTILWSVLNAGATGAMINGDALKASAEGTVTVRATVENGTAAGTDYTQDFVISVRATGVATYMLTIHAGTGGTITVGRSGQYAKGEVINIAASANSDYAFSSWTSSNGGAFGNAKSASTAFTMPAAATTITANFAYTGGGGGGGGGGGDTQAPAEPKGKTTNLPGGITINTPAGQDGIENDDGSVILPGGSTITASDGDTKITAPFGTVIDKEGRIIFPKGGGGTIASAGGQNFNIIGGAIIILDAATPLGYYTVADNPFSDAQEFAWYYDDMMFAYAHGLMTGMASDRFSPDMPTSRGMLVTILYRMAGSPDVRETENPFIDVPNNQWYTDAVKWAAENGIVSGYGVNGFGTDDYITREDLAVILMRYMNFRKIALPALQQPVFFSDETAISDYAMDAIQTFNKLGIITGTGTNEDSKIIVDPKGTATRAQIAAMLHRVIEAMEK